jgi:steroid 5-alpha reductase family enzyme
MKSEARRNFFFFLSAFCFLLMSATILIMPFAIENETVLKATGIAFWLFLVLGFLFNFLSDQAQKAYRKEQPEKAEKTEDRVGLFSFFSNIPASVCDAVLLVGILAAACMGLFRPELATTYAAYILLFFIIFSFCMHCFLNGKKYRLVRKSIQVGSRRNYAKK